MARYTTSGTKTTIGTLNTELEKIQESIAGLLSREGDLPNTMSTALDMNNAPIINFPETSASSAAFPLTGFWPYGHYIKNSAPAPLTDPRTGLYLVTG